MIGLLFMYPDGEGGVIAVGAAGSRSITHCEHTSSLKATSSHT